MDISSEFVLTYPLDLFTSALYLILNSRDKSAGLMKKKEDQIYMRKSLSNTYLHFDL